MSTLLHRILDQGKEEGIRQTAKKMLQQGADIDFVQAVTDLSKEEILALQKQE